MEQPKYGKIIKTDSFYKGLPQTSRVEYQIPEVVKNKNQAMAQVLDCMSLIDSGKTREITITIETDKLGEYKMVTRKYAVEVKA